jgi:UDP-N-acetylmuramate--alanine ligase
MGGFGLNLGSDYKKVYFIGIGGVHMSGLAELLHLYGYEVSGSDARESAVLERLRNLGIPAAAGHDSANVSAGTDLVVITSAVKKENPELARAYELDIPVVSRAALLGGIMKNYKRPVCVSGSHGKTTVTTMIAEILLAAGRNPTVMNGGFCPSTGTTMINGGADFFVVEADEYCDAFLSLNPHVGVILNIEMDHADYFKDFDDLTESFRRFAALVDDGGLLVAYKDFFSH